MAAAIPSKRELNCSPIQAALPLCNSNFNTPSRTTKLMAAPCAVAPSASEIIRLLVCLAFSINTSELFRMLMAEDTKITWQASISSILRRSEEHTSELQSRPHLVCRLLLEKKKQ